MAWDDSKTSLVQEVLHMKNRLKAIEVTNPRLLSVAIMVIHVENTHLVADGSAGMTSIFLHWHITHSLEDCPGSIVD